MKDINSIYPSTVCVGYDFNNRNQEELWASVPVIPPDEHRFTLIDGILVSAEFINRVHKQWGGISYACVGVLTEEDIFYGDFARKLPPAERKVLMPVVLLLMARGAFPLQVDPTSEVTGKAA